MEDGVSGFKGLADFIKNDGIGFIASEEKVEIHSNCCFSGKNLDELCDFSYGDSNGRIWHFGLNTVLFERSE